MTAIGPHLLRNAVLLAPMAGITDAPFRSVAWNAGAGYVASEMVTSQARLWDTDKSRLRREWVPGIEPRVHTAIGNPVFSAIQKIMIAHIHGRRALARRIAARFRLGEAKCANPFAAGEFW